MLTFAQMWAELQQQGELPEGTALWLHWTDIQRLCYAACASAGGPQPETSDVFRRAMGDATWRICRWDICREYCRVSEQEGSELWAWARANAYLTLAPIVIPFATQLPKGDWLAELVEIFTPARQARFARWPRNYDDLRDAMLVGQGVPREVYDGAIPR